MKYYLDTEFIEKPGSIQLISIGIAAEDGRTFYAETTNFDERDANQWVRDNVLSQLKWWGNPNSPLTFNTMVGDRHLSVFGTTVFIRDVLKMHFFSEDDSPEFWAYYADYDWVVFCWIFGRMIELPKKFPRYCRDLKQLLDESRKAKLPEPEGEHNSLVDALWNMKLHRYIENISSEISFE